MGIFKTQNYSVIRLYYKWFYYFIEIFYNESLARSSASISVKEKEIRRNNKLKRNNICLLTSRRNKIIFEGIERRMNDWKIVDYV